MKPTSIIDQKTNEFAPMCWAAATRQLRKIRIQEVGGKWAEPQSSAWHLEDKQQWELLLKGEETFWNCAATMRDAGYHTILSLPGISEEERSTLQVWLGMINWAGMGGIEGTRAGIKTALGLASRV